MVTVGPIRSRHMIKGLQQVFRRIIVGLDGSEKSKKAAHIACDLAKHYAGTVAMVHVVPIETSGFVADDLSEYENAAAGPSMTELEEAGQRIIDAAVQIAENIGCKSIETHMPLGDPATEILSFADEFEADLIITGRRGLSSISGFVLGSTTQQLNHHAKCACMSVV